MTALPVLALPARKDAGPMNPGDSDERYARREGYADGWNDCLEEIQRRNAGVPAVEPAGHEDDIKAVITRLGDDAAELRGENPEDERANNMDVAAATIRSLCKQLDAARGAALPDDQTKGV